MASVPLIAPSAGAALLCRPGTLFRSGWSHAGRPRAGPHPVPRATGTGPARERVQVFADAGLEQVPHLHAVLFLRVVLVLVGTLVALQVHLAGELRTLPADVEIEQLLDLGGVGDEVVDDRLLVAREPRGVLL